MREGFSRHRPSISAVAGTTFGALIWLVNGADAEPVGLILAVALGAAFAVGVFLGGRRTND